MLHIKRNESNTDIFLPVDIRHITSFLWSTTNKQNLTSTVCIISEAIIISRNTSTNAIFLFYQYRFSLVYLQMVKDRNNLTFLVKKIVIKLLVVNVFKRISYLSFFFFHYLSFIIYHFVIYWIWITSCKFWIWVKYCRWQSPNFWITSEFWLRELIFYDMLPLFHCKRKN